jgi:hypothetical protein
MPRGAKSFNNPALLEAALEGLELQKARLEAQIREVHQMIGGRPRAQAAKPQTGASAQKRTRRPLSAAARKRIAAAQKKRWAAYREATEAPAAKPKRGRPGARKASSKQAVKAAKEE